VTLAERALARDLHTVSARDPQHCATASR